VPAEASTERTGGKSKKSKHGQKHGRDYKDSNGRGKKPETVEVTVTLTKLTRRALKDAAEERGMAPEELASLIVSAWLDH
jgi:ribosomal protein S25